MEKGIFWKLVGAAVVAWFAIRLILWLFHIALAMLHTAVVIAVIVGVVYVLIQVLGKKKATY